MIVGKYTLETYAQQHNLTRQSALNKISRLKKLGYITVSGGGRQPRIYTLYNTPHIPTNGFYDIVNTYSPEKLAPAFAHRVLGNYTLEHAIIDGILIGDARTLTATAHLFRHVTNWKRLFELARKHNKTQEVRKLYETAKVSFKSKTMPKRYQKLKVFGTP